MLPIYNALAISEEDLDNLEWKKTDEKEYKQHKATIKCEEFTIAEDSIRVFRVRSFFKKNESGLRQRTTYFVFIRLANSFVRLAVFSKISKARAFCKMQLKQQLSTVTYKNARQQKSNITKRGGKSF
ncbi:MAG: hypothetical protein QW303_02610 [Nitrososphaerota archaeon]